MTTVWTVTSVGSSGADPSGDVSYLPFFSKPSNINLTISASDDTTLAVYRVDLIVNPLPSNVNHSNVGNDLWIEGPTSLILGPTDGIRYTNGTSQFTALDIQHIPFSANPYSYLSNPNRTQIFDLTLGAFSGPSQVDSKMFHLTILNSWDATKADLLNLMNHSYVPVV